MCGFNVLLGRYTHLLACDCVIHFVRTKQHRLFISFFVIHINLLMNGHLNLLHEYHIMFRLGCFGFCFDIILDNDKLKIYCKTYFCVFNASQDCHCQLFDLLLKDEQRSKFGILIIIFPSYILQCCRDNCVIFLMLLSFACRHFQSNLNKKIVYLGFVFISFMFDLWVVCLCLQELCLSLNQVKESPQLTTLGDFQKP